MNQRLQLYGLAALTGLAAVLLGLIGWVLYLVAISVGPDGRVGTAESFGFTALLLSFREVISALKGIWEHGERSDLTSKLADSSPRSDGPTGNPGDPIRTKEETRA